MKYTKDTMDELLQSFTVEANSRDKNLWMITLHPGYSYAKYKDWRDPASREHITLITKGFIGLMNSFLTKTEKSSIYVKAVVVLEKSGRGHWHSHIIIQQTYSNEEKFLRKLNKLVDAVNSPNYMLRVGNSKYNGTTGIGYQNENGQFMHYQKCDGNTKNICRYLIKSPSSTMINILNSKALNDDFYELEPEFVTEKKAEFAKKEKFPLSLS